MGWRQTFRGVVAPWECDENRHLTARLYVPKFDDSAYLLFFDAGLRLPELRGRGFALVTASHHINYLAELRNEDVFSIEAAFVRVGRSSVRSVHKMRNGKTTKPMAKTGLRPQRSQSQLAAKETGIMTVWATRMTAANCVSVPPNRAM